MAEAVWKNAKRELAEQYAIIKEAREEKIQAFKANKRKKKKGKGADESSSDINSSFFD